MYAQFLIGESFTDLEKLIADAIGVVNMFDQANTNGVIEKAGSRGKLLKESIEDLRRTLNSNRQLTDLREDQVRY